MKIRTWESWHGHGMVIVATLVMASTHMIAGILHVFDAVVPTLPPVNAQWQIIHVLESPYWAIAHMTIAFGLFAGVVFNSSENHRRMRLTGQYMASISAWMSIGNWLAWFMLLTMWGSATDPPSSILAPVLVLFLAIPMSALLAWAWTVREE